MILVITDKQPTSIDIKFKKWRKHPPNNKLSTLFMTTPQALPQRYKYGTLLFRKRE